MKRNLSTPKILAGLGALLVGLSLMLNKALWNITRTMRSSPPSEIAYTALLLSIAGFIMLLVAIHQYSKALSNDEIYKKFLIGFLVNLVGTIVLPLVSLEDIKVIILYGFLALIAYVISSYMYKQSFSLIASKLGHKRIETAGKVLFIGSLVTIIAGVMPLSAAWIVAAIGFFTAPKEIDSSASKTT